MSIGFDKCIITYVYHYIIVQSIFTVLKIPFALPIVGGTPDDSPLPVCLAHLMSKGLPFILGSRPPLGKET